MTAGKKNEDSADHLIDLGNEYFDKKDFDTAITHYKKAIAVDKFSVVAHYNWGLALERQEKFHDALEKYKVAVSIDIGYENSYNGWYRMLGRLPEPELELPDFQEAVEKSNLPSAHNNLGNIYLNQYKDYSKAIEEYKKAIKIDEYAAWAYHNWGIALERQGKYKEALEKHKEAIRIDIGYENSYNGWSLMIAKQPDPDKVLPEFQEAVEKSNLPSAHNDLGDLYLNHFKDYSKAIEEYKKAIGINKKYTFSYYNWGKVLERQEKFDEALDKYKEAVGVDPGYENAYNGWSLMIAKQPDPDKALPEFQKAVEKSNLPSAHNNFGNLCLNQFKDYSKAIEAYKKAIKIDENAAYAYHNWGIALERQEKFKEALNKYKEAVGVDPGYENGYNGWSLMIPKQPDPDKTLPEFQKAVEESKLASAHNDLGNLYLNQFKDYSKAIEEYKKIIGLDKTAAYAYHNWGLALERQEKFVDALEKYKKAVSIDTGYEKSYNGWSLMIPKQPDPDKALKELQQAVEKSNLASAHNDLGNLYLNEFKDYAKAIEEYKKAIEIDKNYKWAYHNWGIAHLHNFSYNKALEKFKEALDQDPEYVSATHNYAYVCYESGKFKEGKKNWARSLELYDRQEEGALKGRNHDHFIFSASIRKEIFKDFQKAEEAIEKGLSLDGDNVDLLLEKVELYYRIKSEHVASNDDDREIRNRAHYHGREAFRQCERILNDKLESKPSDDESIHQLAKLYLRSGDCEKAIEYYKQVLDKQALTDDKSLSLRYKGIGSAYNKIESNQKALKSFMKALELEPESLPIRTSLAQAYFKLNSFEKAEKEYRKVLSVAATDLDALLGFSELYVKLGDKYIESKKVDESQEKFEQARIKLQEIVDLVEDKDFENNESSRLLNTEEQSELYYSLGYVKIKLFEIQEKDDLSQLDSAKKQFYKVIEGSVNYLKAKEAIRKIAEKKKEYKKVYSNRGAGLVKALAVVVLVITQVAFYLGRPIFPRPFYTIDATKLESFATDNAIKLPTGQMADLLRLQFSDPVEGTEVLSSKFQEVVLSDQIVSQLSTLLVRQDDSIYKIDTTKWYDFLNDNAITLPNTVKAALLRLQFGDPEKGAEELASKYQEAVLPDQTVSQLSTFLVERGDTLYFKQIDAAPYIVLTFGSLLFIIAGIYLKEVSRLRLGSIELEKTSGEAMSFSSSVGITR